jgi:hypothetical protein
MLDYAEKRQRSGHIYQAANPISMRLTFSLPLSFTSSTASLSHYVSLSQSVQPLPWIECLVPMAFVCVQLKTNSFPSASLFNCGVQPSRIPALEGVYLFENGEIPDSDDNDDDLPSIKKILAHSRTVPSLTRPPGPVIELTCDCDDDETEVSQHRKPPGVLSIT